MKLADYHAALDSLQDVPATVMEAARHVDGPPDELAAALRAVALPPESLWRAVENIDDDPRRTRTLFESAKISAHELATGHDVFHILWRAGRQAHESSRQQLGDELLEIGEMAKDLRAQIRASDYARQWTMDDLLDLPEDAAADRDNASLQSLRIALISCPLTDFLTALSEQARAVAGQAYADQEKRERRSRQRVFAEELYQWFHQQAERPRTGCIEAVAAILRDEDPACKLVKDPLGGFKP